jgi:hypothetical protein
MNKEKLTKTWENIELLQEKLFRLFPNNNAPFEMELFLSPSRIEEILAKANNREIIIKYIKGIYDGREVFYKNDDGTLEKVI